MIYLLGKDNFTYAFIILKSLEIDLKRGPKL